MIYGELARPGALFSWAWHVSVMGILSRVAQVMSANFNALLDRAEDPRKNLDLTLQEMRAQISAARKEVVHGVAAEKQLRTKIAELDQEAEKWKTRAELAVRSSDDALAREALSQKRRVVAERDRAEAVRGEQRANALEMKEALARMERKVQEFELRKGTIATRVQLANAGGGPEALGKRTVGPSAFDEFRRIEDKIDGAAHSVAAQAEVEAVLNPAGPSGLSSAEVESKFRVLESGLALSSGVTAPGELEDELNALKKRVRIAP